MLTIFTSPKAFIGQTRIIQENAIHSWKRLVPECEVLLFGRDIGAIEAAKLYGCKHIDDVLCNEFGTPLISGMFAGAEYYAHNSVLCYVNCDIMFTKSLMNAIDIVKEKKKYLLIGQRYDVDIFENWNFNCNEWDYSLTQFAKSKGVLHSYYGIDYFIFPKSQFINIPAFTVGRGGWDNWMIYHARKKMIPIIDATGVILAVHQNHNYAHCKGGKKFAYKDGPEAKKNFSIIGNMNNQMNIEDALWILEDEYIKFSIEKIGHHFDRLPIIFPWLGFPVNAAKRLLILPKFKKILKKFFKNILDRQL